MSADQSAADLAGDRADAEGIVERVRARGGAATIYDVAELAGVSPSTVSRALNKPGRISAGTEARIRAAASRLSLRLNPMARALHTGRTRTLALVVADITNPMIFDIVRGAEHTAKTHDYTLVIAESQESGEAESEAIERLLPSVDGIVLATTRLSTLRIQEIARQKPTVVINRAVEGVPGILPDVRGGVEQLVGHLAALGHRSVAYLSGPETSWISERRWEHLLEATERNDIALVEIGPNQPTIAGGKAALRRVLAARTTAVVAFNDLIAIGLVQAAASEGVAVPDRFSVAGFDDIFGSELIVPALTTVRSQLVLAGDRAVHRLLTDLGETEPADDLELLETELVPRESTGPAR